MLFAAPLSRYCMVETEYLPRPPQLQSKTRQRCCLSKTGGSSNLGSKCFGCRLKGFRSDCRVRWAGRSALAPRTSGCARSPDLSRSAFSHCRITPLPHSWRCRSSLRCSLGVIPTAAVRQSSFISWVKWAANRGELITSRVSSF